MTIIDFNPARITGIQKTGSTLSVVFFRQMAYDDNQEIMTPVECQLCIEDGEWLGVNSILDLDNLEVRSAQEMRRCFLPLDWHSDQFSELWAVDESGQQTLLARGSSMRLEVLKRYASASRS
ncbi:hypothetical protein [Chitinilyticum aquatile]|uniref:hypothetical protein n=1 Tax=Chitinilyticum aquatile TaxID=362520 RepID=UPI000491778B|nr:hypothetical protein [Chitinilyticum aquatile]